MSDTPKPSSAPGPRAQAQDVADRLRAQFALGDDPRYYWLCDRSSVEGGKPRSWRPTLLTELGRLQDVAGKERMLELAGRLCAERPSTQQALLQIWAAYDADLPGVLTLARAIIGVVEANTDQQAPLAREVLSAALGMAASYLLCEEEAHEQAPG